MSTASRTLLATCLCLLATGCGSSGPMFAISPGILPAQPPPGISGEIGGRPFVARSAVMLPPIRWVSGGVSQTLRIYERDVDCRLAGEMARGDAAMAGERYLDVTFGAEWPSFPGSVWKAQLGSGASRDGSGIDLTFQTSRGGGAASGAGMSGEVRVISSSRASGVVSVQASRHRDDPFMRRVADKDIDPASLGQLAGNVAFVVCRR